MSWPKKPLIPSRIVSPTHTIRCESLSLSNACQLRKYDSILPFTLRQLVSFYWNSYLSLPEKCELVLDVLLRFILEWDRDRREDSKTPHPSLSGRESLLDVTMFLFELGPKTERSYTLKI